MAVLPYVPPAEITDSVDEITVLVTGYGVSRPFPIVYKVLQRTSLPVVLSLYLQVIRIPLWMSIPITCGQSSYRTYHMEQTKVT